MPDLHQPGPVLSLPLLGGEAGVSLERDLAAWTKDRPLALILPCHVRDLESEALSGIIGTLSGIGWVSRVVVGLDGAQNGEHALAVEKFRCLTVPCEVLHHAAGNGSTGKGRNLRACAARVLEDRDLFAVAMHDCDIRSYSREFLARLCWPVLHPEAGRQACKGYYARHSGQLHGRVFRLLFQPLLKAWAEAAPDHAWVKYLQGFRYPLSGELCVRAPLLRELTFDDGWGVEVRLLHGLYQAGGALCQAELCAAYDHKHHGTPELITMAAEVAGALTQTMIEEGVFREARREDGLRQFERHSLEAVADSALVAQINGLTHDRSAEEQLAEQFREVVRQMATQEISR